MPSYHYNLVPRSKMPSSNPGRGGMSIATPLPSSVGKRRYGWIPDLPDMRDHMYQQAATVTTPIDLRTTPYNPPITDQGYLGSCTAHAWARLVGFAQRKQGMKEFSPSTLQLYYNERMLEGTVPYDSGAMVRTGAKVLAKYGVAPEEMWPYDINKFRSAPPAIATTEATKHTAVQYQRLISTLPEQIKTALSFGNPVVFGMTVYESFESSNATHTGMIPMPSNTEKVLGGHSMVIMGFTPSHWIVANSWGTGWGDKGYCYIPITYLTNLNLSDDFWVLQCINAKI